MEEPKRLSTASENDMERALLRAGRGARAPRAARDRALAAATAVVATTGFLSGSAAARSALGKVGSGLGAHWLTVVGLASAAVVGGGALVEWTRHPEAPIAVAPTSALKPPAPVSIVTSPRAPDPASPPVPPEPSAPEPVAPAVSLASPSSPSTVEVHHATAVTVAASGSSVHDELALLEGARAAIRAGDPARGLSLLNGYLTRFPNGAMAPEATVLRIEALIDAGDRPAAVRASDAFLAAHPGSPYVARVRSLLGKSNP